MTQQSVDYASCLKQIGHRRQRYWTRLIGTAVLRNIQKISPVGGYVRAAAVWKNQEKVKAFVSMEAPHDRQRSSVKRVVRPRNGDLFWKVVRMGSVLILVSIASTMNGCCDFWNTKLRIGGFYG
jgi:hypothetical protein